MQELVAGNISHGAGLKGNVRSHIVNPKLAHVKQVVAVYIMLGGRPK